MEIIVQPGIYLYGIVKASAPENLGAIGIDGKPLFLIPVNDICAIVHKGAAIPYSTKDTEKAKIWILSHQYVLDLALARYGTVIPITFDTIFKGEEDVVQKWLNEKYDDLNKILLSIEGKAEYGIQIYLEEEYIQKLTDKKDGLLDKITNLPENSEGVAYLLKKKIHRDRKVLRDHTSQNIANELYNEIKTHVKEVKTEETRKAAADSWKDMLMILNLSCLLDEEKVKPLGDLLGKINQKNGVNVRFTGPWPPYSFVTEILE